MKYLVKDLRGEKMVKFPLDSNEDLDYLIRELQEMAGKYFENIRNAHKLIEKACRLNLKGVDIKRATPSQVEGMYGEVKFAYFTNPEGIWRYRFESSTKLLEEELYVEFELQDSLKTLRKFAG